MTGPPPFARRHARCLAIVPLLCAGIAAADESAAEPATPSVPAPQASTPAVAQPSYSFFSTEEFRERRSSLPDENDSLARLSIDAAAASANDKFSASVGLGLWWEVAGQPPANSVNTFDSIHGSPDSAFWLDVYRLSLEYKPDGPLRLVRIGRQDAEHGRPATFDGADLEFVPWTPRIQLFAFGGRTVHFFEIDPKIFEDWIGSAGADIRISHDLKLEVDYRILRDAVPAAGAVIAEPLGLPPQTAAVSHLVTNNTYGLTLQWRYQDWVKARAWARGIGDAVESVGAAARLESLERLAGVELKLDIQPAELDELNELDNPFFLTLGQSLPHLKGSIDGWEGFESPAGSFTVHLGTNIRQLFSAPETPFNRNLFRFYLLGTGAKLGGTDFYFAVNGEYDRNGWSGTDGTLTAGVNAGWSQRYMRFEVGTYFQRWRYVYFQQPQELANVRGYYADASYTFHRWLTVRGRYSYEIFDRILQTFTVSLSQAF